MRIKKFGLTVFIYCVIFGGLNILFSWHFVVNMENFIQEGLLGDISVVYDTKGNLQYNVNESFVQPYDKYGESLRLGGDNQLLFSKNGLAMKRQHVLGKQFYVIDYSWLPSGKYNEQEIKDYVKDNRLLMLGRSSYLSDSVIFGTTLFAWFYGLSFYLMPIIMLILTKAYIYLKSKKKSKEYSHSELAESMLLKLMHKKWDKSWETPVFLGLLSYLVSSTNMANVAILTNDSLAWVSGVYISLLLIICLYFLQNVYVDIDIKRLDRKLSEEKIDET